MNLYVIEKRDETGSLDFSEPQPNKFFGLAAITGISEDAMAKVVFRLAPDAVLTGMDIPAWPSHVDARFSARRKTW